MALPAEGKCVVRLETTESAQYFWDDWAHFTANDGRRYGLAPDLAATNLEIKLLRNDRLSRLVHIETAANGEQGTVIVGSVFDAPLNPPN